MSANELLDWNGNCMENRRLLFYFFLSRSHSIREFSYFLLALVLSYEMKKSTEILMWLYFASNSPKPLKNLWKHIFISFEEGNNIIEHVFCLKKHVKCLTKLLQQEHWTFRHKQTQVLFFGIFLYYDLHTLSVIFF